MDKIVYLGVEFTLVLALFIMVPFPSFFILGYENEIDNFSLALETFASPDLNLSKINLIGLRGHVAYRLFDNNFMSFKLFVGDIGIGLETSTSNISLMPLLRIGAKLEIAKSLSFNIFATPTSASPYIWPGAGLFVTYHF